MPHGGGYRLVTEPRVNQDGQEYYLHTICDDIDGMVDAISELTFAGRTAYYSMAALESSQKKGAKSKDNVIASRCFYADIDCGPDKKYADKREAADALFSCVKSDGLPTPTLVIISGNGLHAYWVMTTDVKREQWERIAVRFKALLMGLDLKIDKAVTADISRILRPVGAKNFKNPDNPKAVKASSHRGPEYSPNQFTKSIIELTKQHEIAPPAVNQKSKNAANSALSGGLNEFPPSDAELVAKHCPTLAEMRDTKGAGQDEAQWYKALGVLLHTEQGEALCHDWSEGHEGFNPGLLDKKLKQLSNVGPTTCAKMREVFPSCEGCEHTCNSPISLGYTAHKAVEEVVAESGEHVVFPKLPQSLDKDFGGDFTWTKRGLEHKTENPDGGEPRWFPVCTQLPVPEFIFWDDHTEQYCVRFESFTLDGKRIQGDIPLKNIFTTTTALVGDLSGKCAVTPINTGPVTNMVKTWVKEVRDGTDLLEKRRQMGWQTDKSFLLGSTLFLPDGTEKTVVVSNKIADMVAGHEPRGDINRFVEIIDELYNHPRYEEYQFGFVSSFASVLMELVHSGNIGVPIVFFSRKSATGKTTLAKIAISVWGDPNARNQVADASRITEHAMYVLAGLRHNLPVLIDETSLWEMLRIQKFAYGFSSGMAKVQGDKDGGLRDNSCYDWKSAVYLTTNRSVMDAIANVPDSGPQLVRIFEVNFDKRHGTESAPLIEELFRHTGLAGRKFVKFVVKNRDAVRKAIEKERARINTECDLSADARFWAITAACVSVAFKITQKLKLHAFPEEPFQYWMKHRILDMRSMVEDNRESTDDLMHRLLKLVADGVIVTDKEPSSPRDITPLSAGYYMPRVPIARAITTTGDLYIPVANVRALCRDNDINYNDLKSRLETDKILVSDPKFRYYIGKGTNCPSVQAKCWHIKWKNLAPHLQLVNTADLNPEDTDGQAADG